ncbi:MAG TPA: alpha/beta hydrolase-fold protein [Saprospiraceae bacterium]|nr:alpha/beta hydrolase-fold protein [Saprospiraceae bacterium]
MMRKGHCASITTFLLCVSVCHAQVIFRIISLPSSTPPDVGIYLSGNFEGWTGGQEAYRLHKDADSLFSITLTQMTGTIQFKFTRGSWASVEKGMNGEEIANRTYTFGGNGAVVNITIHNWADLSGITSTAAENIHLMDDAFYIPQLDRTRKIWIYLPPAYETSQDSFPVLYMHDGQNLFDDSTSFAGEWGVDESLNEMYDESGFAMIVVGIENDGAHRIDEYSPWINPQYGGGEGEEYIDFLVENLKPYVDSTYRTISDPALTGLMGSSMGGLISHYGGIAEPDVFGRIGVFSPSFGLFDSCYAYTSEQEVDADSKFYFLAGGLEGNVVAWTQQMEATMLSAGANPEFIEVVIDPQGMHNEVFWRGGFREAVEWLFDVSTGLNEEHRSTGFSDVFVYPNPVADVLHVESPDVHRILELELFDATGVRVCQSRFQGSFEIDITDLISSVYILRVMSENELMVVKVSIE